MKPELLDDVNRLGDDQRLITRDVTARADYSEPA
jgi:hypothetical protein